MTTPGGSCATPGCTNPLEQKLACPKCIKLGLPPSYFCSQKCFVDNYSSHKSIHSLAKTILLAKGQGQGQGQGGRVADNNDQLYVDLFLTSTPS